MSNIAVIKNEIYAIRDTFQSRLVKTSLNFEVEAGFAVQQLESNDYLLSVAMNNRQSVINAVTNVAAIGISLNPARKQAYLVPRDKKPNCSTASLSDASPGRVGQRIDELAWLR